MESNFIRNFCIIAHIDHGKSTLADRLLELTKTVSSRDMKEQFMDQMDLERERGITIKGKAVRMTYHTTQGQEYQLNLIDTPGHVDFSYEVSRALASCEGALLLVDASQGIQAQTLANAFLARDQGVKLIPVVNKIDLTAAEPERVAEEMAQSLGFKSEEVIFVSAKEGTGVPQILQAIVERVPAPKGESRGPLRALVFDSKYDPYKGVLAYVRVMDGEVSANDEVVMMVTGTRIQIMEVGVFRPQTASVKSLTSGEVGYVATGLKTVRECRVGDTITSGKSPALQPLPGYRPVKPMVFAGFYPAEGESYEALRDGLEKLQLNDAALVYGPESSPALGIGFRCGFLGLLHMDIAQERLEREYGVRIVATSPSVGYQVLLKDGQEVMIDNPAKLPAEQELEEIREPWLEVKMVSPARYIGPLMELVANRRGEFSRMEYLAPALEGKDTSNPSYDARVLLEYRMPLGEVLIDFYDQLKSSTQGYASVDYILSGYRPGRLVKLDILLNNRSVDALSFIVPRENAYEHGKALVEHLRALIPRQLFEVVIQAAVGSRVISRESIKPLRKNVLAKCYGGDITRKRKLLEKQAEGKKRLKMVGQVEVPQEAFLALLKMRRS